MACSDSTRSIARAIREDSKMKSRLNIGASIAAILTSIAMPAVAQEAPADQASAAAEQQDEGGLQEIIVTAQKRSENVQNVPVAITAISGDALSAKGATDVASLAGQAPNVTLRSTAQFGGSSSILISYIRGIGQNDFAFNLEPGVGVYVDGVYLARNIGANADLLDLERIEVLKGPQGTLFGRNTMGGALSIVTRDPGNELKYKAEVTTGRFNRVDFRGSIDVPLVQDVLVANLAVSTKHRDGYQKRIPYTGYTDRNPIYLLATNGAFGGPSNTNTFEGNLWPITDQSRPGRSGNQNQTAARGKLVWTPTSDLKVRLIGDYLHTDEQAAPFSLLRVDQEAYVAIYNTCITGNPQVFAGVAALTGFGGIPELCSGPRGNAGSPTGVQPSLASKAGSLIPYDNRFVVRKPDGSIDPDRSYAAGANYSKIENWGINGQLEYDFADSAQLKSITAYRKLDSRFGVDTGGDPTGSFQPTFADSEKQFTQELQIIGRGFDNRWKYVLGAYYFNESGKHVEGVAFPGGLLQINSPNDRYETKSYAVYTHNSFEIIPDRLGVTLGARYTHENKRFQGTQQDENRFIARLLQLPASFQVDPNDPTWLYPLGLNKQSFNNFSFRIGAEYHLDRDIMAYASYATAFKGGGWTTRLTGPLFNPTNGQLLPAPTFAPEKAKTAEVGLKATLFDRRLRVNLAGFHTDYNNIQLTFVNGSSPVTANGGNGKIDGFEVEVNAAPVRGWSLDASLGYLDARYTKILPGIPLTGNENFVNTPKWTMQAGTSVEIETGAGTFVPRVDWTYATKTFNDESNTVELVTPAHSFFNASVTYRTPIQGVELQAGVTNLTDKRIVVSGFSNAEAVYQGVYSRPREWFLTLRYSN